MDVWASWCRRDSKCRYCEETIKHGEPVIIGKIWSPGKWNIKLRFHPQCWLQQAMNYLEKNPYTPRRLKELDDVQAARRQYLLVRYATCKHRLQDAAITGGLRTVSSIIDKMLAIREEISQLGGIPTTWESLDRITETITQYMNQNQTT